MSTQELITLNDVELVGTYADEIIKKAKRREQALIGPLEDEVRKVTVRGERCAKAAAGR